MESAQTFQNKALLVDLARSPQEIHLKFRGKSTEREPGAFLTPVIQDALDEAGARKLVLDFTELEYMNSSSVTPIIKLLNEIKNNQRFVRIVYSKARKWQELSFSALMVFQTRDGRIEVTGQ